MVSGSTVLGVQVQEKVVDFSEKVVQLPGSTLHFRAGVKFECVAVKGVAQHVQTVGERKHFRTLCF